jgi:cytochrome P450
LAKHLGEKGYSMLPRDSIDYTSNIVNQVITRRRQHLERRNDFIQMMIDREEEVTDEGQTDKQEQQIHSLKKSLNLWYFSISINCFIVALNDKEILGQALVFMIAGYETTSVLMSFFFYVMATEPAIQEKVYEEIRQEIGDVCY